MSVDPPPTHAADPGGGVSADPGVSAGAGVAADPRGGASADTGGGVSAGPRGAVSADPLADVRRGYFVRDKERHARDAPRFCPSCSAPLLLSDGGRGIAVEYWEDDRRVFACYCGACSWAGEVVLSDRIVGHEAEH